MTSSWHSSTLGELCDINLGRTPARADKSFWDEKRETKNVWLSIADLPTTDDAVVIDSKEYLSDKGAAVSPTVPEGTLMVSFKLTLGRLAVAGRDLFTNEAIAALPIRNERTITRDFLSLCLQHFDWIDAAKSDVKLLGMTLNKSKLKVLPIRYPPLAEQLRIVRILEEAFDAIATAKANSERNLANAEALFESQLESTFARNLMKSDQKTLKEVSIDFGRGKSKHRPRNDPKLYGGPYPFIQTGDVRNSSQVITEASQSYNEFGLSQSKLWPAGTLCITIAANIAETAVLGIDACFPDSVIGVVADPYQVSSTYLEYMLHTVRASLKAKGKGSAQDNINLATFENERFPVPDLQTQAEVVQQLGVLSEQTASLVHAYTRKLAALDELKESLLHQAFAGEL